MGLIMAAIKIELVEKFEDGGMECPPFEPNSFLTSDPRTQPGCAACFAMGLPKRCMRSLGLPEDADYIGKVPCSDCDKLETEDARKACKEYNCNNVVEEKE